MKKPVCLLLVFVLAFAMSAGAFAENVVSPEKDNTNVDVDDEPSSPQTGDSGTVCYVVAAMLLAVGAVALSLISHFRYGSRSGS